MVCMKRRPPTTLRRSVALPSALLGELNSVAPPESGLPRDTVFLCFQVRSSASSRSTAPEAGALPAPRMAEVDAALRRALDL